MLNHIIAFSLKNRSLVLAATVVLLLYGGYVAAQLPIDVFPDLNRPTVTIITERRGLRRRSRDAGHVPDRISAQRRHDVLRVRSASGIGLSIVWVEFEWGTDIYIDRQIVNEKLQLARPRLPRNANPLDGADQLDHGRDSARRPAQRKARPTRWNCALWPIGPSAPACSRKTAYRKSWSWADNCDSSRCSPRPNDWPSTTSRSTS